MIKTKTGNPKTALNNSTRKHLLLQKIKLPPIACFLYIKAFGQLLYSQKIFLSVKAVIVIVKNRP